MFGWFKRKRKSSFAVPGTMLGQDYSCCFCSQRIAPIPPDICSLALTTRFQDSNATEDPSVQQVFCHAKCLKKLLPSNYPFLPDLED